MELVSSLYRCEVFHERLIPKKNRFRYSIFMFFIDIDDIEKLSRNLSLVAHNRFNIFSFYDMDHFKKADKTKNIPVRSKLNDFLSESGIELVPEKVMLLTNLRILGYVFNPVSFYYCYDNKDVLQFVVAEVSNTFGEMKMYLVTGQKKEWFESFQKKHFYISPFTKLDDNLSLKISFPADDLKIFINDWEADEVKVKAMLTGKRVKLTDWKLLVYFLRFPFITLQIIFLIHWQALKLWLKGVKFYRKNENKNLQTGLYYTKD